METADRRKFLKGSAVAAGWAALASGGAAAFGAVSRAAGPAAPASGPPSGPPSARFLAAVADGDIDAVRTLLAADPGLIHMRDAQGRSAFAVALLAGHRDVADIVVAGGHRTDLHEAALALDWDRFASLAEQAPGVVNQLHPLGGTAMYAAAAGGAGADVWRVFSWCGDPNVTVGAGGFTPLRAALEFTDLPTAELTAASIVGNGADPNAPQAGGSSPLHAAALRGSVELTEALIRKGARLDAEDAAGRTPLALAEAHGQRATAKLLRSHAEIPRDCATSRTAYDSSGAPYRPADMSAFSALERERIVGASHRAFDVVKAAVDRYPELAHSVASTTEIAVEACGHTGHNQLVDYLLDKGAPYSVPTAAMRNDLKRVRELLDEDPARINERGAHDFPLLWYSVIGNGSLEMAELLLARGAQVERQHWLGTTALHWACGAGEVDLVRLFIEHGADVQRSGRKFVTAGETPLGAALRRDKPAVARLLREHGASG